MTEWTKMYMHHRLSEYRYFGHLELTLYTITPVFIPSYSQGDVVGEPYPIRRDPEAQRRTFKRFHHNGREPTIPGTTIRGMIRSVFEALTNSCMVLFAETYGGNCYKATSYKNEECNAKNGLCPACSVFGTILGNDLPFQGKVRFSDAIGKKADLESEEWILKELSAPRPERRIPFYAKDGNSPNSGPRGRKFYFHHDPKKGWWSSLTVRFFTLKSQQITHAPDMVSKICCHERSSWSAITFRQGFVRPTEMVV